MAEKIEESLLYALESTPKASLAVAEQCILDHPIQQILTPGFDEDESLARLTERMGPEIEAAIRNPNDLGTVKTHDVSSVTYSKEKAQILTVRYKRMRYSHH